MRDEMLAGLPIFACALDKGPLTPEGFYDAVVGAKHEGWPLVGVQTGRLSGIDVIDVDPEGLGWLADHRGELPVTRMHQTRRGWHLLFRHTPGLVSSGSRWTNGVDVRADEGWVIWWPREGFAVENGGALAEMPEWLRELNWIRFE